MVRRECQPAHRMAQVDQQLRHLDGAAIAFQHRHFPPHIAGAALQIRASGTQPKNPNKLSLRIHTDLPADPPCMKLKLPHDPRGYCRQGVTKGRQGDRPSFPRKREPSLCSRAFSRGFRPRFREGRLCAGITKKLTAAWFSIRSEATRQPRAGVAPLTVNIIIEITASPRDLTRFGGTQDLDKRARWTRPSALPPQAGRVVIENRGHMGPVPVASDGRLAPGRNRQPGESYFLTPSPRMN